VKGDAEQRLKTWGGTDKECYFIPFLEEQGRQMKVLRVPCARAGSPIRTFCALAPLRAANNSYWDDINKQRLQLELIAPSLGIQDVSERN